MSNRYKGGVLSATPPTTSSSAAPGIWTLEQQMQATAGTGWPFGGPFTYIEELFSTYLYTGSSSAQTITNGIDLLNKGGLVWLKGRNVGSAYGYGDHELFDSANVGSTRKYLRSDGTDALAINGSIAATPFTASGFNLDAGPEINNRAGDTNVSWTFRKQPKFFDVVTYTGTGSNRTIAHNLGSTPGVIIIKQTSAAGQDWPVYHRSLGPTYVSYLDLTNAASTSRGGFVWNNTAPTSTVFSVGIGGEVNSSGETYVAYLFAHDAGGFGLSGTDNVISCGSFTTDGSGNATVNLGYEPQWTMTKRTDSSGVWSMNDVMRGMPLSSGNQLLEAQSSAAESTGGQSLKPNATGFTVTGTNASATFIYIAIRRGPMKVPTDATKVFAPVAFSGTGTNSRQIVSGFTPDLLLDLTRNQVVSKYWYSRLTGNANYLQSNSTAAAAGSGTAYGAQFNKIQDGYQQGTSDSSSANASGSDYVNQLFQRAPGFFDEVCYTGTGSATTFSHNLGVVPELMIFKVRGSTGSWQVYAAPLGATNALILESTNASAATSNFNNTAPTSSVFSVGSFSGTNGSGLTYVNYLFASCPGVSKVGSFTGTGATQVINCGFTGGARFVLIKATSTTGDWYVWDSARGIVAGNDPYLEINTTDAEVTTTDWVDTAATGFELSNSGGNLANTNGVSYIFLAIA